MNQLQQDAKHFFLRTNDRHSSDESSFADSSSDESISNEDSSFESRSDEDSE